MYSNALGFQRLVACAVCLLAAVAAIRRGWAEVLFSWPTRGRIEQAIRLDPGNAFHHVALGRILEEGGDDPRPALRDALFRLPADALLWVRLGLAEEAAGNTAEAERLLLRAAKHSRKHDVRWTLANFYFRQGKEAEFVHWARETLLMAYGDSTPLFDLAAGLLAAGTRIRTEVLPPDRRPVWIQYAFWSAGRKDWVEAEAGAAYLGGPKEDAERATLASLAEVLLASYRNEAALELWQRLGRRGVASMEWRTQAHKGVSTVTFASDRRWRVNLTGDQPERCELLVRLVPPGVSEIRWKPAMAVEGFYWEARGHSPSPTPVQRVRWQEGRMPVAKDSLSRVALVYERPPRHVRFEGELHVELIP